MTATRKPRPFVRNDHDTEPTEKQRVLFDFVVRHAVENLYQPSVREIGQHIGSIAPNAVYNRLHGLQAKGWVGPGTYEGRAIRILRKPAIVVEDVSAFVGRVGDSRMLTIRQRDIFVFVVRHAIEHLYQPSYEEIAAHFGFAGKSGVTSHVRGLHEKGWIEIKHRDSRAIRILRKPSIIVDYSHLVESGVAS